MGWIFKLYFLFKLIILLNAESILLEDCKLALFTKKEGIFQSVKYPNTLDSGQCFIYHFEAPSNKHVEIEFLIAEIPSYTTSE